MAKYTRKFEVKLDGQEETILYASLTAAQVDQFLLEQSAALAETDAAKRAERREKNTYQMITNALNNVSNGETWTIERAKAELDKEQLDALLEGTMKRSGLAYPKATAPEASLPSTS